MTGRCYGVGVGPGDPELLTLKAARLIASADVIAYPQPDDGESFARAIVAGHLGHAIEEPIVVPMRTERFPAAAVYDEAAERLGVHLDAGRDVVVLCEGDPFFYGSFMYLFGRMRGEHPIEIVPGVSSLVAGAAAASVPLAARNDVLSILPGPLPDDTLTERLASCDAAAIIKLGRHYPRVRALIERLGLLERAHYCERIGTARERIVKLSEAGETAPYFSLILIDSGPGTWESPGGVAREGSPA